MTIAICKNRFTDFHSPTKNNTVERVERFPSNGSQLPVGFVSVKTESFMYFTWTLSRTLCSPSNTWRRIDRPCALCQCRIIEIKVRAFAKCHHLILQINLQRQDNGRGILFLPTLPTSEELSNAPPTSLLLLLDFDRNCNSIAYRRPPYSSRKRAQWERMKARWSNLNRDRKLQRDNDKTLIDDKSYR